MCCHLGLCLVWGVCLAVLVGVCFVIWLVVHLLCLFPSLGFDCGFVLWVWLVWSTDVLFGVCVCGFTFLWVYAYGL